MALRSGVSPPVARSTVHLQFAAKRLSSARTTAAFICSRSKMEKSFGITRRVGQSAVRPQSPMDESSLDQTTERCIVSERRERNNAGRGHMNTAPTTSVKVTPPAQKETRAGNYFVSNYPPYSF